MFCLPDVRSEIHLVWRNIVLTGQSVLASLALCIQFISLRTTLVKKKITYSHSAVCNIYRYEKEMHVLLNCMFKQWLFRSIFSTLSDNEDAAFNSWRLLAVNYFLKTLHFRCFTGLWNRLCHLLACCQIYSCF